MKIEWTTQQFQYSIHDSVMAFFMVLYFICSVGSLFKLGQGFRANQYGKIFIFLSFRF